MVRPHQTPVAVPMTNSTCVPSREHARSNSFTVRIRCLKGDEGKYVPAFRNIFIVSNNRNRMATQRKQTSSVELHWRPMQEGKDDTSWFCTNIYTGFAMSKNRKTTFRKLTVFLSDHLEVMCLYETSLPFFQKKNARFERIIQSKW